MSESVIQKQGKLAREFEELKQQIESLPLEQQQLLLSKYLVDPLLSDIPENPTSAYVENIIKVEIGQAFPVYVVKFNGERIKVIVSRDTRVKDLKLSLQAIIERQEEHNLVRKISWRKGVWKNYCLVHQTIRLLDPEATMAEYNIGKDAEIYFSKYREEKRSRAH